MSVRIARWAVLGLIPLSNLNAGELEIVHEGTRSVSSAPFYSSVKEKSVVRSNRSGVSPKKDSFALENRLPISTTQLVSGAPRVVTRPHQQPVFVLGGDEQSKQWLAQHAAKLAQMGATGVAVSLDRMSDWHDLKRIARAHGLALHAVSGDAIAEAFQIGTYPTLITREDGGNDGD